MEKQARLVTEALKRVEKGLIVVVTGAGVSAPSGLPTFRGTDPGAIWNQDVTEIGTRAFLSRDPVAWWQWFIDRFSGVDHVRPNPAHHALATLERWQKGRGGDFLLITQNVDTLHEQAGSERLVKVHGTADRLRCTREGCTLGSPAGSIARTDAELAAFRSNPGRDTLPSCPVCGSLLRAHVLLFDEFYDEHMDYGWNQVRYAVERMALVLFAGTSFSVGVTDLVLRQALGWKVPVLSIDPAAEPPWPGVTGVRAGAEEVLPEVCRELGLP